MAGSVMDVRPSLVIEEQLKPDVLPVESAIPSPHAWAFSHLGTYALGLSAIAIGTAGTLLRLVNINALGLNSDEAVYAGQAASIAGSDAFIPHFPIFRAHPLLFQSIISLGYHSGVSDLFPRVLAAAVGMATVYVTYLLASYLYGRRAGVLAAAFLALMPYHVVVSRQVLLDGPMAFFTTLTLYLLARFAGSGRTAWLYAAGGSMGLSVLSKETSIVMLGAVYAFFALSPSVKVRLRQLALSMVVFVVTVLPFPLSLLFAGRGGTGEQFLAWQLFRRPNHGLGFYPSTVPRSIGFLVVAAAILGLVLHRGRNSWREILLGCWIAAPVMFFEVWPVKGFQYLLPAAAPLAVLAARAFSPGPSPDAPSRRRAWLLPALATVVVVSLVVPSWAHTRVPGGSTFLAGSGGVVGGREAGRWVADNVPVGGRLLALGPSMANIIQFYGHRKTYGLSVSPNPLHRNPVYEPVYNPDLQIRTNELQYIVWDSFSASRTPFFSRSLLRYAERYHGRVVHTESVPVTTARGKPVRKPVIVIYEVRP